jgi:hypothetical protein
LAIDGCCVLLMQMERVIHLVIATVWQTVTIRVCFFVLFVPSFGLECSLMIQSVIALDRFIQVFFPLWFVLFGPKFVWMLLNRSKTVDKKMCYFVVLLCLTVFGSPTIFLTQNAIELLGPTIANTYVLIS